jgi:cytoplasmic polyadenylation element-binding protein
VVNTATRFVSRVYTSVWLIGARGNVSMSVVVVELAMIMGRLYGGVCYAGIDTDPELKYPKGAGRVAFSSQQSYIAAISARFVQLQHGDIDKRVSVLLTLLCDCS